MAVVFTSTDLDQSRQQIQAFSPIVASKPQFNAAVQACEVAFEAWLPTLAAAIETAAPGIFTLAQKKIIARVWLSLIGQKGGF